MAFILTGQFPLLRFGMLSGPSLTLFQMRTGVGMPMTSQLR